MSLCWSRSDLEEYHNLDGDLIYLGDEETQIWWGIDKAEREAYVWDSLNEDSPVQEFESQRELFGIDPNLYDNVYVVAEEEVKDLLEPSDKQEIMGAYM